MFKKVKEYLLSIYLILNILYVCVGSYLFTTYKVDMKLISKTYIILLILNIITIITYLLIKKFKKKEKLNFHIADFIFIFIFIFGLISSIFSINTEVAFFGFRARYEGFFQIMYYFSLFFLGSMVPKNQRKIILVSIILCGSIETLYAICQKTKFLPVFTQLHYHKPWATGFTNNPNFFGTLSVLCLSITIGLLFDSNTDNKKILYGFLTILFTTGLLLSDTLSALVGLLVVLIYLFIYSIIKKKIFSFLYVLLVFVIMTITLTITKQTDLVHDLNKTKNQSVEIVKGNIKDNYGTNRIYIWKNTLKIIPDNKFIGVGIDNFYYAFGDKPLTTKGFYVDKAHHEYLQILVCEGIPALISYLSFFGIIFISALIYSYKKNKLYLFLPLIGYFTQAFFNISVIEVAPYFYVVLGLALIRNKEELL